MYNPDVVQNFMVCSSILKNFSAQTINPLEPPMPTNEDVIFFHDLSKFIKSKEKITPITNPTIE